MKRPFASGDTLELTPVRLGKRGEAEASCEGWRVRIPGGIPGEAARVQITHVSKGGPMAVGRFLGPVREPHPARRAARCPIHESCGGCGLQQIEERAALAQKVAQAQALFDLPFEPAISSPRPFHYRAKTFLLPQVRGSKLIWGARPPRGPRLVETSGCVVLRPELEALAARVRAVFARRIDESGHLRAALLRCNRAGRTQVTLVHRGEADWLVEGALAVGADAAFLQRHDQPGNRICSDLPEVQVLGERPIAERFGQAIESSVPPTAFWQGNPDVAEQLYLRAAQELDGESIAELYCGSGVAGLLALHSRPHARLTGIDKSPRSIASASENARRNGLAERCRFVAAPAEEVQLDWDRVLVNPPRAGCPAALLDAIGAGSACKLVYLSCSPAGLARDLGRLGWRVDALVPADMFPQTPHLELLAVVTRP